MPFIDKTIIKIITVNCYSLKLAKWQFTAANCYSLKLAKWQFTENHQSMIKKLNQKSFISAS